MNSSIQIEKVDFGGSIVGFEQLRYFQFKKVEGDNPFFLLASEENEEMEFIIVSPFEFYQEYEVAISDDIKQELQIESHEDVMVMCTVTIHKPFKESTLNLIAPLLINVTKGVARQIILNGSAYPTRAKLFPVSAEGN
ncbi:flagellar assembly protein FliW [Cohnella mopanensis]|uniref:flagellar assembly protein FliW n=1 Tax=Cohnella mopanensis TaxID=2911966 RepID=UPI001EF7E84D|nr:flagellar assembly protein FliW [Cohnella mopanensis]